MLCRRLVDENFDVRLLLRNPAKIDCLPVALQAKPILGDLLNEKSLLDACADIDTIYHLAGSAHVNNSVKGSDEAYRINVVGSENLLKAALKQNVRRVVYLSSSLAHAAETNAGDVTAYGRGKRAAEIALLEAADQQAIEVLILRPVNVYGVGMKGNIASMISMIHRRRLPRLPALSSKISLLGVEDLAAALLLAAGSQQTAKIYTVTDGQDYPIAAIEEAIYRVLGRRLPRWKTPAVILYAAATVAGVVARIAGRESSISSRTYRNLTSDNLFTNNEICRELGFQPTQNLYQLLPEIADDIVSRINSN